MRRVASALGIATMSLYNYVPAKNHLIQLMCDQLAGEYTYPSATPADKRPAIAELARQARDIARRHPWLPGLLHRPPPPGPNGLRYLDYFLGLLANSGLDTGAKMEVISLISGFATMYGGMQAALASGRAPDPAHRSGPRPRSRRSPGPRPAASTPILPPRSRRLGPPAARTTSSNPPSCVSSTWPGLMTTRSGRSGKAVHPMDVAAGHPQRGVVLADGLLVRPVEEAVHLAPGVVVQLDLAHAELIGRAVAGVIGDLRDGLGGQLQILVKIHEPRHDMLLCSM
jgi:AcrR family transcriptional regulator